MNIDERFVNCVLVKWTQLRTKKSNYMYVKLSYFDLVKIDGWIKFVKCLLKDG